MKRLEDIAGETREYADTIHSISWMYFSKILEYDKETTLLRRGQGVEKTSLLVFKPIDKTPR